MGQDCLTFVTWKYVVPDSGRDFPAEAVNVLYAMLARHFHAPFRLVCLTDDSRGIRPEVDVRPLPVTKADHLKSPHNTNVKIFPSCYRRLWLFSQEATALGARLCNIDLDVVILADITELICSRTAAFVGWHSNNKDAWLKVAGGIWMLDAGSHTHVWDDFDPATSPQEAHAAGFKGSDQAWLSYKLYPAKEYWTARDGFVKAGWIPRLGQPPPPGITMVFFNGFAPPWRPDVQLGSRWITEHWRL